MKNEVSESGGKQRVRALDVMRGITIVCMIIVNNGAGPQSFSQLQHSEWNGLTVCDLVFPFFLFIMGITTYLSMASRGFRADGPAVAKVLRRTLVILLICWALHWFDGVCHGRNVFDLSHLRLTGVLTRIALCYCAVSMLAFAASRRAVAWVAAGLLVLYGALLLCFSGYINGPENINNIVDHALLPDAQLYTRRPVDPEGLLGTLPAIAHTIIGFCCGAVLRSPQPVSDRLLQLFVAGALLVCCGLLASAVLPVNKRVWSPSYVLVTCGAAAAMLATLSYYIDIRGYRRYFTFFETFGVNPLFLYVLAEALAPVFGVSGAKDALYSAISGMVPSAPVASAVYAIVFALLMGLPAVILYRRRIYIKI